MATVTDMGNTLKETINVDLRTRVTPQPVKMYNPNNEFWGKFSGYMYDAETGTKINIADITGLSDEIIALSDGLSSEIETLSTGLSSEINTICVGLSAEIEKVSGSGTEGVSRICVALSDEIEVVSTYLSSELSTYSNTLCSNLSAQVNVISNGLSSEIENLSAGLSSEVSAFVLPICSYLSVTLDDHEARLTNHTLNTLEYSTRKVQLNDHAVNVIKDDLMALIVQYTSSASTIDIGEIVDVVLVDNPAIDEVLVESFWLKPFINTELTELLGTTPMKFTWDKTKQSYTSNVLDVENNIVISVAGAVQIYEEIIFNISQDGMVIKTLTVTKDISYDLIAPEVNDKALREFFALFEIRNNPEDLLDETRSYVFDPVAVNLLDKNGNALTVIYHSVTDGSIRVGSYRDCIRFTELYSGIFLAEDMNDTEWEFRTTYCKEHIDALESKVEDLTTRVKDLEEYKKTVADTLADLQDQINTYHPQ